MATSTMKPSPGVSRLEKYGHYRDMMSFPAPSTKPVCAKYQRGECTGLRCPYFHPKNLVVDKPAQPAPQKTTPIPTKHKQPGGSTPIPTKPPVEPTPKTSTSKSPQPPKNDKKSVTPAVVPERPEQKPAPVNSRPAKSQAPQDPVASTHVPQQPRPSPLTSGAQTKARTSNPDGPKAPHVKNLNNTPTPVKAHPQTVVVSSVAIGAITQDNAEPAPTQQIPPSPSASGTSSRRNDQRKKKKVQTSGNPTKEISPPPGSVPPEQSPTPEPPPVQCDPESVIRLKKYICRDYLHKHCSRNPCPFYHDPSLVDEPPLCGCLYTGPCTKNACSNYHPEGDRRRMICKNFLHSRCYYQGCTRFHFRLPVDEEACPVKADPVKVDPIKVDPVKVDPVKVDPVKVNPVKVNPVKVNPVKVNPVKVNPAKVNPVKVNPVKVNPAKVDSAKVDTGKVDTAKVDTVKRESFSLPPKPRTGHAANTDRRGANQQPVSSGDQSLSSPTSSTHGTGADVHRTQCPAWNDGFCPNGRHCEMLHIHWVERWRMEAAHAAAKTMNRIIFDNTKVVFGAGCEIKQITTALESCRVLISYLPARVTKEALEDFLVLAGFNRETFRVLVLRMSLDGGTQEASVIFDDAQHAKTVVEVLDKKAYHDEVLKFELAPAVTCGQMDDYTYNRSSYVEITFDAPSMRVQAIYPTVEDAIEKAKTLNGRRCRGRSVGVTVAHPPQPTETWTYIRNSIIISNVALSTSDSEILAFARPFSMKTFAHKKFRTDLALQRLEAHMRSVGDLKPGDFDTVQNYQKGTIIVRGRFDTWEQADKVWQSLQETDLEFLVNNNAQTFLAFPHQYSLHIPLEHYDAQKEIYDNLESQHGRERTAHIVATRFSTVCLIQVVGIDKRAVGALKLKVERIAQGEVVGVWDRFFLDWQGKTFFGRLLRLFGAYVRPDYTKQVLRVYGSEAAVGHARREIQEQMGTLAALDYKMNIERRCIGFFIQKGMGILGDMLGEDNVWLHTTSKPYFVSVRGGHDAEHALQNLVSEALRKPLPPPVLGGSQTCPLCFEEPTQPFPLACRHIYCTGCLKHMLISATDGKSIPICCIGNEGRCKTPIPLPVIERFISPARLTQMFENSFRVHLQLHPNEYRFCPTPDCTQIYRVSKEDSAVIQCPACLIETCSHCHKSPHRGLTCEENTLIGSKSGQERLLQRWAKGHSNVKQCPDCGVFIEKIDGCNHIHCRCGGHVCWICVRTFNNGIYDHLNTVHGGAYDADH